jgi:uncharacterized zinc-type alcohol dehydrogenase-like protein
VDVRIRSSIAFFLDTSFRDSDTPNADIFWSFASSNSSTMIQAKGYAAQRVNENLAPWNFQRRTVGPHDVQVRILYCGVCHTDLHKIRNNWGDGIFPMVPGHEIVGKIINTGSHASKFRIGDLAGVGTIIDSCRACDDCKSGYEQFCQVQGVLTYNSLDKDGQPTYGGYSDTIVVNEDFTHHISPKLNLAAVAPLLCAGITTYSPLRKWKVGHGHKLAVVGSGGLGHMGVKFGVALGAAVTVISTSPNKAEAAKRSPGIPAGAFPEGCKSDTFGNRNLPGKMG